MNRLNQKPIVDGLSGSDYVTAIKDNKVVRLKVEFLQNQYGGPSGTLAPADADPEPAVPSWYFGSGPGNYTNLGINTTADMVFLVWNGTAWSAVEIDLDLSTVEANVEAAVSAKAEADAIQLLRLHDPNLTFAGFAVVGQATPTPTANTAYIATESGTIFGIAGVVKGQILVGDGSGFGVLLNSNIEDFLWNESEFEFISNLPDVDQLDKSFTAGISPLNYATDLRINFKPNDGFEIQVLSNDSSGFRLKLFTLNDTVASIFHTQDFVGLTGVVSIDKSDLTYNFTKLSSDQLVYVALSSINSTTRAARYLATTNPYAGFIETGNFVQSNVELAYKIVRTRTYSPLVDLNVLKINLAALDEKIYSSEITTVKTGNPDIDLTDITSQKYTDYLWILKEKSTQSGELKELQIAYKSILEGNFKVIFFSENTDYKIEKIINLTLPSTSNTPTLTTFSAGVDFDEGIFINRDWVMGFLNESSNVYYFVDNTGQPPNSSYLKYPANTVSEGDIISGGSSYAWLPEISFTLNLKSIDKRIKYLETNSFSAADKTAIRDELNEHESRISIIESTGIPTTVHDVAYYGAVGDGITDDTLALQNAVDANYDTYLEFPEGEYLISDSIVIENNINIIGKFRNTIIKGTGNFPLFKVIGGVFSAEGITFQGSSKADNATKPLQNGIYINSVDSDGIVDPKKINIQNCEFYNLANFGIEIGYIGKDSSGFFKTSTIHNVNAFNCFGGFYLGIRAEFITLSIFNVNSCDIGLYLRAGNLVVSNGSITQCGVGIKLNSGDNSGHGVISNIGIKHNSNYSIYAENDQLGYVFNSLNIFDGDIYLKSVKGYQFNNCQIDVNHLYFEAAVKCRFLNNLLYDNAYTLHHNYNSTISDVTFDETLIMNP